MEKKTIKEVSSGLQNAYQRAMGVVRKNNTDYAIELLKGIIQKDPAFIEAREALREQEKKKLENLGGMAKVLSGLKTSLMVAKAKGKIKKAPQEAMKIAEDALALNLDNPAVLNTLADAAVNCEASFIAVEALELIKEYHPKNESNLRKLAELYERLGEGIKVLQIRQKIAEMHPGSLEAEADVRAAAALASMQKGKWEEEGSFQEKLADKGESEKLEQEDRVVRDPDDIRHMIERIEQQISEGEESIDVHRKLADLYFRAERFDDSIKIYDWITEKMGSLDPAIDRSIEKCNVAIYNKRIEELNGEGGKDEQIQELETAKYNYRLERAVERVNNYPNDTLLRYNLAVVYWEGGYVDNALEQFQIAQKNPNKRLSAIVYLGRCFQSKGQHDLAVEQFQKAIDAMPVMDKDKMNALYHLGVTYDDMSQAEKAMTCFKEIYQANVNYMDVAQRMDNHYKKQ